MPRQEWGGIEPMGKIFLLTFLFIGQADLSGLIGSSMSDSAIWHKLSEEISRWLEFGYWFEIVRLSGFIFRD
jgi:hypothetical protein